MVSAHRCPNMAGQWLTWAERQSKDSRPNNQQIAIGQPRRINEARMREKKTKKHEEKKKTESEKKIQKKQKRSN